MTTTLEKGIYTTTRTTIVIKDVGAQSMILARGETVEVEYVSEKYADAYHEYWGAVEIPLASFKDFTTV